MNRFFGKTSQKVIAIVFCCCVVFFGFLQLSSVHQLIVTFVEDAILGRKLGAAQHWLDVVAHTAKFAFVFSTISCMAAYLWTTFGKPMAHFHQTAEEWRAFSKEMASSSSHIGKVMAVTVLFLLFAFMPLLNLGYDLVDDLGRNFTGNAEWGMSFMRWVTFLENYAIQLNELTDSSPLTQVIAIIILAAAVVVMALPFSKLTGYHQKITVKHLLASLIMAFNPWFLECLSYKYDSVGMTSSLLFSLIPFMFVDRPHLYCISSLLGGLLMCMSYQASSGIYIIMVMIVGIVRYAREEEWNVLDSIRYYLVSAAYYLIPTCIFYFGLTPIMSSYRSTEASVFDLSTVAGNAIAYAGEIFGDLNSVWLLILFLLVLAYEIAIVTISMPGKRRVAIPVSLVYVPLGFLLSYGAYLFLSDIALRPRMIYGCGIFFAVLANVAVSATASRKFTKVLSCLPTFLLLWSFFSYSFIYTNALESQLGYEKTYEEMILADLNELLPQNVEGYRVGFYGSLGHSPLVKRISSVYPITEDLVRVMVTNYTWSWGSTRFVRYYDTDYTAIPGNEEIDINGFTLIKETKDYDILVKGNDVLIRLREDQTVFG